MKPNSWVLIPKRSYPLPQVPSGSEESRECSFSLRRSRVPLPLSSTPTVLRSRLYCRPLCGWTDVSAKETREGQGSGWFDGSRTPSRVPLPTTLEVVSFNWGVTWGDMVRGV